MSRSDAKDLALTTLLLVPLAALFVVCMVGVMIANLAGFRPQEPVTTSDPR